VNHLSIVALHKPDQDEPFPILIRGKVMGTRWFTLSVIIFFLIPSAVQAQQEAPLGTSNFSFKLDYINFIDNRWSPDTQGGYMGLEGYWHISPNVYLGGEIGAGSSGTLYGGDAIHYNPIELNVKYAREVFPNLVADFGTGVSYSYASIEGEEYVASYYKKHEQDVLFGGQAFAGLTYRIQRFPFIKLARDDAMPAIGVNVKYQVTQDFNGRDVDFNNLRLGVQLSWLIGMEHVLPPPDIQAEQKAPLGTGNFAVKSDLITFTDHFFRLIDEEQKTYVAIEGYGKVYKDVYLGGELGFCTVSDDFQHDDLLHQHRAYDTDLTFLELNAKYAKDLSPHFVIAAGGGLSWIKIDGTYEVHNFLLVGGRYIQTMDRRVPESDWLVGGQIFTDLTFTYHWLQIGINAKYQVTQEMKSEGQDFDVNNYRLGAQVGALF